MKPFLAIGLLLAGCGKLYLDAVRKADDTETVAPVETDGTDGRIVEPLGRGLVAVDRGASGVYLSWRLLRSDGDGVGFNIYRDNLPINDAPILSTTDYTDKGGTPSAGYFVRAVIDGEEYAQSETTAVLPTPYRSIPLSGDLSVHRVGIGDLDRDGEYDFVVRRPIGTVLADNTHEASTDTFKLEGYNRDGALLWRIDLGWNIELGETFCPTLVYDLDGDGVAEVIQKSAEGTVDGEGKLIADADDDGMVDYRDENGRVLGGPEFLSVFGGGNGAEIARADWIPRGETAQWGDTYGNRVNHNFLGIAYLDGVHPSIVAIRGIAELQMVTAYDYSDGALSVRWTWSSAAEGTGYVGQAYHTIRVGDIDGDGRDEVIPGAYALDDDGTALWTTFEGHGDRLQLTDVDPSQPGLELWYCQEASGYYQHPVSLRQAASGALIFGPEEDWGAVVRAMAADIDPDHPGMELWGTTGPLFSSGGAVIGENPGSCNFAIYWDGDPLRELFDGNSAGGYDLYKWNWETQTLDSIEVFDGRFAAHADVFGDWREEIVMATPNELRIYTTVDSAEGRLVTLMQDSTYRLGVVLETMGSYESAQPGFLPGISVNR